MATELPRNRFDVIIATDLRFPGGSSGSTLEEINVQHNAGLKTGVYHLPSTTLKRRRTFHPGILKALLEGKAELVNPGVSTINYPLETDFLLFRHPSVVDHHDGPLPDIITKSSLLAVNHPPINSAGRIDYLLPYALDRLRKTYTPDAVAGPIGPLVRSAVERYYMDNSLLSPMDWNNIFDLDRFWARDQPVPRDPIRIGRHSRPNREKWPETSKDVLGAYPDREDIAVHVLGGTAVPEEYIGYRPKNWVVHEFGSRKVEEFLHEIDVFVYFHHSQWVEAFGRVVAEAMATGLPCILPQAFEPLFGEAAMYGQPRDVVDMVLELNKPDQYRKHSKAASRYVKRHFSAEVHLDRLRKMGVERVPSRRSAA